jgi:hypothetical protein
MALSKRRRLSPLRVARRTRRNVGRRRARCTGCPGRSDESPRPPLPQRHVERLAAPAASARYNADGLMMNCSASRAALRGTCLLPASSVSRRAALAFSVAVAQSRIDRFSSTGRSVDNAHQLFSANSCQEVAWRGGIFMCPLAICVADKSNLVCRMCRVNSKVVLHEDVQRR